MPSSSPYRWTIHRCSSFWIREWRSAWRIVAGGPGKLTNSDRKPNRMNGLLSCSTGSGSTIRVTTHCPCVRTKPSFRATRTEAQTHNAGRTRGRCTRCASGMSPSGQNLAFRGGPKNSPELTFDGPPFRVTLPMTVDPVRGPNPTYLSWMPGYQPLLAKNVFGAFISMISARAFCLSAACS